MSRACEARLRLAPFVEALLERWSRDAYPVEACGVLLGRRTGDELALEDAVLARNLLAASAPSTATHAFDLHPADLVLAEDRARSAGREVLGIWHSHPDASAEPSASDRELPRGWCQVLVGVHRAPAGLVSATEVRAWRDGRFELRLAR